jgi:hypothetical protein
MTRARCVGLESVEAGDDAVDSREDVGDSSGGGEECVEEADDHDEKRGRSSGRAGAFCFRCAGGVGSETPSGGDSSDSDEDCVEEDDDRNKKCERSSGRAGTFGF